MSLFMGRTTDGRIVYGLNPPNQLPTPRPTAAQTRNATAAEAMLTEAMRDVRAENLPELLAGVLVSRFGAVAAERIGERVGTLAHMAGRV